MLPKIQAQHFQVSIKIDFTNSIWEHCWDLTVFWHLGMSPIFESQSVKWDQNVFLYYQHQMKLLLLVFANEFALIPIQVEFYIGQLTFSDSALSLSTRKRKSDTSEPISESWSRTEQYKVNANSFSCCPHFVFARIFCDINCYFLIRFVAVISGPLMISCGGRLAQRSEIRSARRFSRFR